MTPAKYAELEALTVRVEQLESAVFALIQQRDQMFTKRAIQAPNANDPVRSSEIDPPARPDIVDRRYSRCSECGLTFAHYATCQYAPKMIDRARVFP